jgi:hypothetical protein
MSDPALQAAAAADAPFLFGAIRILFPGYTLRLLDGAAEIMIGGEPFVGQDGVFGTLESIGALGERIGDEAPEIEIGLLPPDASAAATLSSAAMQGSRVEILFGAYDPATGAVVGTPELLFLGEIDVPTIECEQGARRVSYSVVSVFERLFEVNEGERASHGWHQSIWPGERGLEYMTGTSKNLYWGAKLPVRQVSATPWPGGPFAGIFEGVSFQ